MTQRTAAMPFILLTLLLTVLGFGLIIPVMPKLVAGLAGGDASSGAATYGWFVALYAAMQFLFAPVLGALSDQYGRRPVILLSLLGASLDYALLAWAPSMGWLFVGRVISGITGANITAINAYVADVSPPEKRAQNYGMLGACFGLGFIIGPAMGGLLGTLGPRWPFVGAAILNLANAVYGFVVLPESLKPEHRRAFEWKRANPLTALLGLRKYPTVSTLVLVITLLTFAQMVLQSTWVLFTTHRFAWTELQTGMSLAVVGLSAAVVQGGLSRVIIPKLGEKRSLVLGMVFMAFAFVTYGLVPEGWMLYPALMVGSISGLAEPSAQSLLTREVGPREQGAVQGALAGVRSLAGVVAPPIFNTLFGYFTSPAAPVQIPGVAFFGGAAFVVVGLFLTQRAFSRLAVVAHAPGAAAPVAVPAGQPEA